MGAKVKTKAPALNVPQTDEAADRLLLSYGAVQRYLADAETEMQAELARVKAAHEAQAEPYKADLNNLFERLQAWAEANRTRLTGDGKVKTVELPSGKIAWRIRPPSIRLTDRIEDIIERIRTLRVKKFLRIKTEINREAMLEDPARAATIRGVKVIRDVEDFVVEPFAPGLAEPRP